MTLRGEGARHPILDQQDELVSAPLHLLHVEDAVVERAGLVDGVAHEHGEVQVGLCAVRLRRAAVHPVALAVQHGRKGRVRSTAAAHEEQLHARTDQHHRTDVDEAEQQHGRAVAVLDVMSARLRLRAVRLHVCSAGLEVPNPRADTPVLAEDDLARDLRRTAELRIKQCCAGVRR